MDPAVHKRFLDYRELYIYFGRNKMQFLNYEDFESAEKEYLALEPLGEERDEEDQARFAFLAWLIFRD